MMQETAEPKKCEVHMAFVEAFGMFQTMMRTVARGVLPVILVGLVLIVSLFAGAIISSIFVHAVEF